VPKDYLTRNLIGNFHQMRAMTFELRDWSVARRELELAAASAPDNDVLFYNLGLIYRRNGLLEDALAAFRRSAEINPGEIASLSKPRAADRASEVHRKSWRGIGFSPSCPAIPPCRDFPRGVSSIGTFSPAASGHSASPHGPAAFFSRPLDDLSGGLRTPEAPPLPPRS
jgi:tetratricopeptide (TPR) repeat protein